MTFVKGLGSVSFTLGLVVLCSCSGDGFSSMCSGDHLSVTSQILATPPFDSVEIFIDGAPVDSSGTPCATATNGACQTEYRAVAKTKGARFVTTRGDEVRVVSQVNREDLGATTDTPEEATLVVMGWSLETACKAFDKIEARAVAGGFEVSATKPSKSKSCEVEVGVVTFVDSTGKRSDRVETVKSGFDCEVQPIRPPGGGATYTAEDTERGGEEHDQRLGDE